MSGDLDVAEVSERLLGMELRPAPKAEAEAAAAVAAAGEEPAEKAAQTAERKEDETEIDEDEDKETAVKVAKKEAEEVTEPAEVNKIDKEGEDEEAEEDEDDDEDDEEPAIAGEPEDLDELADQIASGSRRVRFFAIQSLRRRVSDRYEAPAFSRLLTSPALPALVANVDNDADSELQFESLWALTNLLAGSGARPTDLVASSGLGRPLLRLLKSGPTDRLREQACWALANIVGESAAWRDQLLSGNSGDLLAALEALWDSDPNNGLMDASSLLLVNLFRDRNPRVRFEAAQRLVPRLVRLLRHPYEAAVPHVVWAASYAVEDCEPRARLLLREPGALDCLAGFLATADDDALLVPTLRLFCGLSACMSPLPVAELQAAGVFASVCRFIDHEQTKLRRQALLFFGNVSGGPEAQLDAMVQAGCLTAIGRTLTGEAPTAGPWERSEAFWILPNFLMSRSHRFSERLINECLDGLLDALTLGDSNISRCGLLCLRHLLFSARYKRSCDLDFQALKRQIEAHDGVRKIELAQKTDDKELVKLSFQLVDQFFWGNEAKYMPGREELEQQQQQQQAEGKGGSGERRSQEAGATGGGGSGGAASPGVSPGISPGAASASPEIGDDDRELRDSEAEQPQVDKEALSSLIGGLQARD